MIGPKLDPTPPDGPVIWPDAPPPGHRLAIRESEQPVGVDERRVREERLQLRAAVLVA